MILSKTIPVDEIASILSIGLRQWRLG